MWITREKLWINAVNWGKLAILFDKLPVSHPPYMGGGLLGGLNSLKPCGMRINTSFILPQSPTERGESYPSDPLYVLV